jgi:hypothetical protein
VLRAVGTESGVIVGAPTSGLTQHSEGLVDLAHAPLGHPALGVGEAPGSAGSLLTIGMETPRQLPIGHADAVPARLTVDPEDSVPIALRRAVTGLHPPRVRRTGSVGLVRSPPAGR